MESLPEYSTVRLRVPKRDGQGREVAAGSIGAIVHVHGHGDAYEVEVVIVNEAGVQVDAHLVTAEGDQIDLTWRSAPPSPHSRVLGCLLGGAAGDAYGAPCEGGQRPSSLAARLLRITDDTQLTVATCEAIVSVGSIDPAAVAARFAELFRRSELRGLGASTYKALSELAHGGHWAIVGRTGEQAAGNGAAMRIAPLAFCLDPRDPDDRRTIRDICRITHKNDEAYSGALAVVLALHAAWTGGWSGREGLLERVADQLPDTLVRDRVRALAALMESIPEVAKRFGSSGYVVESVPLALYAAESVVKHGLMETFDQLVEAGGDTDTTASLAGQIIGTYLGLEAVPRSVLDRIEGVGDIRAAATRFSDFVAGSRSSDRGLRRD